MGIGNNYDVEQALFALALWPKIRTRYDILHVQDPTLALILDRLYRLGLSRPRVILANGGTLVERFVKPAQFGEKEGFRYRIYLQPAR